MLQPLSEPIRVFIVDDSIVFVEALGDTLARTPEGDIVYVGGAARNTPNLPQLIRAAGTHVVVLDLLLGSVGSEAVILRRPETSGYKAIQALRQSEGLDLKIIAYSVYPHLRAAALQQGADIFLSKTTTVADIRQTIRYVMGRAPAPGADPFRLGRITGIEIFVEHSAFVLHGDRSTEPIPLETAPFVLLYYLALERQQKAQNWARWVGGKAAGQGDSQYELSAFDVWQTVNQDCQGSFEKTQYLLTQNIAQWATRINTSVRQWRAHTDGPIGLIQVPGAGNSTSMTLRAYSLTPTIPSEGICIHPKVPR